MTNARSDPAFVVNSARRSQDGDQPAPLRSAGYGQGITAQRYESAAPHPLDEEFARVEEAYQVMLVADTCLRSGADRLLLVLGFSQDHIDDLRAHSGPGGGYPPYALRIIRRTLRMLARARQANSDTAA